MARKRNPVAVELSDEDRKLIVALRDNRKRIDRQEHIVATRRNELAAARGRLKIATAELERLEREALDMTKPLPLFDGQQPAGAPVQ